MSYLFVLADPLTQFTQGPDKDLIARVRNVVAISVMGDLAREDPQGTNE